jgi:hypothetical protein
MAPLINTLLTMGPSLIRLFGQSKGGKTEVVAETLADVVNAVQGKPLNEQNKSLTSAIHGLPTDILKEIELGLAKIEAERENNRMQHDLGMHQAQQSTLQSRDIKGVRPAIASRHSWFTIGYISVMELASLFDKGSGANMEIAIAIASPTLAWFGFRTWDKFSNQGASK